MNQDKYPSLEVPPGEDAVSLLTEVFGQHYDIRAEEEAVRIGDRRIREPVIRVYAKGESEPRLSLWLCR